VHGKIARLGDEKTVSENEVGYILTPRLKYCLI
jgi:hypothetical protein